MERKMMMSKEIEIEAKNILTSSEFQKLCEAFSITEEDFSTQINYYFDTEELSLKSKKSALRIREKNNQFTLTIKEPNDIGLLETNEAIPLDMATQMIDGQILPKGEVKDVVNRLIGENYTFTLLGSLTTSRAEVSYLDGTLVFDKSTYLDKTDFELEYEGSDEEQVEKNFQQILDSYHIPKRPTKNKIVRFFEYKQEKGSV